MGFMVNTSDEDIQIAKAFWSEMYHAVTCNRVLWALFVGERKLVHKYIIHIKANVDVSQCNRWSTNILQEQTASFFGAKQCLFYPEDGGNRSHQNVDTRLTNHTASHIARQCSRCSPAWESYTVKIFIHDTILSCSVVFWISPLQSLTKWLHPSLGWSIKIKTNCMHEHLFPF